MILRFRPYHRQGPGMSAGHSHDSVPHTMNKGTQMGAFVHGMGNVSAKLHTFAAEPKETLN